MPTEIVKADGSIEVFDGTKLQDSLMRAGARDPVAERIRHTIEASISPMAESGELGRACDRARVGHGNRPLMAMTRPAKIVAMTAATRKPVNPTRNTMRTSAIPRWTARTPKRDDEHRGNRQRQPREHRNTQKLAARKCQEVTRHLVLVDPRPPGQQIDRAAIDGHGSERHHDGRQAQLPHQDAIARA